MRLDVDLRALQTEAEVLLAVGVEDLIRSGRGRRFGFGRRMKRFWKNSPN